MIPHPKLTGARLSIQAVASAAVEFIGVFQVETCIIPTTESNTKLFQLKEIRFKIC